MSKEKKDNSKSSDKKPVKIIKKTAKKVVKSTQKKDNSSKNDDKSVIKKNTRKRISIKESDNNKKEIIQNIDIETVDSKKIKKSESLKPEDFDWSSILDDQNLVNNDKEEEMYSSTMPEIEDKQVIDGKVVSISDREVIVDINFKSDGVISSTEFKYNPDLKIGDEVEILVEKQEDKNGQLILSHRRARVLRSWERVNKALDTGEVVNGKIKSRTKGGMIAEVFGIEAFLPGSQIDVKPIRDYDEYVGQNMEFKVVKVNESFRNIVVSHKALIEADLEGQKEEIMSKLEKGQVIEGIVKNITSYGVFVDLGGVDGLIHITDLSWGRVSHPEEIVKLDESINVVILEFDQDKKRIQLGLKQLGDHPWDALDSNMKEGDVVNGKVVVVADYGVFVEIQTGIEALVHVSEMSWSTHLKSAGDFYKVGDNIKAKILTLDREERKMSLGVKQLSEDPWQNIDKKYSSGSTHKVTVRNFTNFGIFVELEEGVDGLVHISDLSWTKKINHPAEFTKVGETMNVIILDVDTDNRRISLGHKQLEDDPWDDYSKKYLVDSEFDGVVKDVFAKGAIITFDDSIEAFSPLRHIEKKDKSRLVAGDKALFRVLEFSRDSRKILVSHTVTTKEKSKSQKKDDVKTKKVVKEIQESQMKSTLGDLDELSNLKDDLEENV